MKHGDFTELAKFYINRPAYSVSVIQMLKSFVESRFNEPIRVAEVGAGTGKLTKILLELGLEVDAVEPNDAMRKEGIKYTEGGKVKWSKGSGEVTGLDSKKYHWVLMASSFHWTDPNKSLPEFHRLLKDGGCFTSLWNPRDLDSCELNARIENVIRGFIPNMKRRSSGSAKHTIGLEETLVSTDDFKEVIFVEGPHQEVMERDRYMGVWKSVNDIQVQAGDKWEDVLSAIEGELEDRQEIIMPYKTRSWTVSTN